MKSEASEESQPHTYIDIVDTFFLKKIRFIFNLFVFRLKEVQFPLKTNPFSVYGQIQEICSLPMGHGYLFILF